MAVNPPLEGLTIVIPALNEAATIGQVVRKCLEVARTVLVVDDGSADGTGKISEDSGATVVRHERPQGYDAAIADGVNRAFAMGCRAAITCDADGQHRTEDVRRIAQPVLDEVADFCAGVRDRYNRPVEAIVGLISAVMFSTRDPFCGLKCYGKRFHDLCGDFPQDMNIGTLPLVWMKKHRLRSRFLGIHCDRRLDRPRFGTSVKANLKLAQSFFKSAWVAVSSSSKL